MRFRSQYQVIGFVLTALSLIGSDDRFSVDRLSAKQTDPERDNTAQAASLEKDQFAARAAAEFSAEAIEFKVLTAPIKVPEFASLLHDDFDDDSRKDYRLVGDVEWQQGSLTLPAESSIGADIDAGRRVIWKLRFHLPQPEGDGDINASLHIDRAPRTIVDNEGSKDLQLTWTRRRQDGRTTNMLSLTSYSTLAGVPYGQTLLRTIECPDPFPVDWTIEYNHSQVKVTPLDQQPLYFVASSFSPFVDGFRIEAAQCSIDISSLSCEGIPRFKFDREKSNAVKRGATYSQRASTAFDRGQLSEARELGQLALNESYQAFPLHTWEMSAALRNAGWTYAIMGDVRRARLLVEKDLAISSQIYGKDHVDYAYVLALDSFVNRQTAYLAESAASTDVALQIIRRTKGEEAPEYEYHLNELAVTYHNMHRLEDAESIYQQLLALRKAQGDDSSKDYLHSVINLANLYQNQGRFAQSLKMQHEALEKTKQLRGGDKLLATVVLNNLGTIYDTLGDRQEAVKYYGESLKTIEQVAGNQHPQYLNALNNLADVQVKLRQLDEARANFEIVKQLEAERVGKQHPKYARVLLNLAAIDTLEDELEPAREKLDEAERIVRAIGEPGLELLISVCNLQAQTLARIGDVSASLNKIETARQLASRTFGDESQLFLDCLSDQASIEALAGQHKLAWEHIQQTMRLNQATLDNAAGFQSERQQLRYQRQQRGELDRLLKIAMLGKQSADEVYQHVLQWKGSIAIRQAQYRRQAQVPEIEKLLQELRSTSALLTNLELRKPTTKPKPTAEETQTNSSSAMKEWQARLDELRNKQVTLQQSLADANRKAGIGLEQPGLTIEDLQKNLSRDSVIVDYVLYSSVADTPLIARDDSNFNNLVAFVVSADEVQFVELGRLDESIFKSIQTWRRDFYESKSGREAGQLLRTTLWTPLESSLRSHRDILISTDGELGLIPFAALPGDVTGEYLIDRYAITYVPIPRLMAGSTTRSEQEPTEKKLVAFGGITYGTNESEEDARQFKPLNATLAEAEAINQLFGERRQNSQQGQLLKGSAATEQSFRELAADANYIHIATHGFARQQRFAADSGATPRQVDGDVAARATSSSTIANNESPVLSGFVLANANSSLSSTFAPASGEDDGWLTADEISYLQLPRAELVVISACESGLGEITRGEGMVGLQRAFQIAGAQATMTTLWKVEDQATAELMRLFYLNLWQGNMSRSEALRRAQLAMLDHYDVQGQKWRDGFGRRPISQQEVEEALARVKAQAQNSGRLSPRYWAAFVLSGE